MQSTANPNRTVARREMQAMVDGRARESIDREFVQQGGRRREARPQFDPTYFV
jgi:hypothetical protein